MPFVFTWTSAYFSRSISIGIRVSNKEYAGGAYELAEKILALVTGIALGAVGVAQADLVQYLDSDSFDYKYEMSVNPSGQDLDGNTTADWFAGVAGSQTIPQTYTDGVAYSNQGAATPQNLFRTDFGGSISRAQFPESSAQTLELSVAKTGGTQGSSGWFGVAMQTAGTTTSIAMIFKDDRFTVRNGASGAYTDYFVGTNFSTGSFHTLRVAKETGNNWYVYVDGTLLNSDTSTPFAGTNGNFNSSGSWFIGDYSSGIAGNWAVDYIRIDNDGAYAIPEPATFGVVFATISAIVIRRRRLG